MAMELDALAENNSGAAMRDARIDA